MKNRKLRFRKFKLEDKELLDKWFADWNWTKWDIDGISPYSYFLEVDGSPVAFSSYYKTVGTNHGFMGVTVVDRQGDKSIRHEAVDLIIDFIFEQAGKNGVDYLSYFTDSEVMVERFEKKGALVTDRGTGYILVKSLNGKDCTFLDD